MALSKITADSLGANAVTANAISNTAIIAAVGYTPANKAGDTFTGNVVFSANATVTGAAAFSNTVAVTGVLTASANVNIDSGTLFVNGTTNKVGINTTAPSEVFEVAGTDAYIRVNRTNNEPGITFRYNDSGTNRGDIAVTSGGAMYFTAGGYTERMRIDASGRVTTPYQPSFRANYNVGSPTAWTAGASILNFTSIDHNVGSHYDGTNKFTAPVAGSYLFILNKAVNTQGPGRTLRHPSMTFLKNGGGAYGVNVAMASGTDLGAGDYTHFVVSVEAIIVLAVNDYVQAQWSYNNSPATLYEYASSYFQGYLLG